MMPNCNFLKKILSGLIYHLTKGMSAPPAIPKLIAVVLGLHRPLSYSHFDYVPVEKPGVKVQNYVVQYGSHMANEHLKCCYFKLRCAVNTK